MHQRALDGLVLPIHDHRLGATAIEFEFENGVVSGFRVQDARDLSWIQAQRERVLAGAIKHRGNLASAANTARLVLVARGTRLGFQKVLFNDFFFSSSCHNLIPIHKNNLLTDVSS